MDADGLPRVEVGSGDDLWSWLEANHARSGSVWLVTWKVSRPDRYVSREQVLDALVAYGWIDGRRMKLDAERTMQLISPRVQQIWAKTYKDRARRLEGEGRMRPAGLAALERARQSGLLDAMEDVDALDEPEDLVAALAREGGADWWSGAAPSYRRNILRWIASAKRDETRQTRIRIASEHAGRRKKVRHY